ncbi:DUF1134 domain-containing protein [Citromicrobium bathyomarinum]|jgi:hypothetical protein|uniref:DUF1134 domain-containing protein n=1 Tax=Sphingomonadales TaxID=204457 RepID=UPI000C641DDB|nr:hypothetical protein [Citromicrobium sp.]|tara:strand:- start:6526 stop:7347 length:822 start_codon:yes stop_codon:yes gene_type:complete
MPRTLSIRRVATLLAAIFAMASAPLAAQSIEQVDPNLQIDGDISENPGEPSVYGNPDYPAQQPAPAEPESQVSTWSDLSPSNDQATESETYGSTAATPAPAYAEAARDAADDPNTWQDDDLIGAAQGFFGENAEGIARMIERVLADQGKPNGYIVGREAGGAFIVGARYGSGTLYHKIEGKRPVYWTGPSIGFDVGANGGKTFVLVYNLFDTEELYARFPAGEGQAYFIGGVTASYLRKGDKVLIPIRMGAGLRLGVNAGYMKFSKEHRWLPF